MKPGVGPESSEYRAICLYGEPSGRLTCEQRATRHVRVTDDGRGDVALPTCDAHAPIARLAGGPVAEHEHSGYCGLPGTIWHDMLNICVLDDSGTEPVLSPAVPVAVAL